MAQIPQLPFNGTTLRQTLATLNGEIAILRGLSTVIDGLSERVAALEARASSGTSPTVVAPAVTTQPTISGSYTTGSVLTLAEGAASGTPAPTGTFQWLRGTTAISGATGSTYTLVSADEGQAISARVTWTNSAGSATATSNAITGQAPAATPAPAIITAPTATPNSVLPGDQVTLSLGTWSAGTPVGTLMQGGVNRAGEIVGGKWTAADVGGWTWAVTNGAAAPHVIEGTVTLPQAITVKQVSPFVLPTVMEGQALTQPLSALFESPYGLTYALSDAPSGVTLSGDNIAAAATVAIGSYSFTVTATDRYNQTASLSITLAVQKVPAGQTPAISYEPDATMTFVVEEGTVTITLTEPADYAGSYTVATADFAAGPVCLVPPAVSGTNVIGQTLTARRGLWVYDADKGPVALSGVWHQDGQPISGATTSTLVVDPAHAGKSLTWLETAAQAQTSRTSLSNATQIVAPGAQRDTFTAPDGTQLRGYLGESGIAWADVDRAVMRGGILRPNTFASTQVQTRLDQLGADQYAEGRVVVGTAVTANSNNTVGLGVRLDQTANSGYVAWLTQTRWYLAKTSAGTITLLTGGQLNVTYTAGQIVDARLEARGSTIRLLLDGVERLSATDTTYTTGRIGIRALGTDTTGQYAGLTDFGGGSL